MCVISMVMDHYRPQFDRFIQPQAPQQWTITQGPDLAELRKLIEDFKAATEAAKKVDALTAQPNCEDPEKAKLQERVAELEGQLAAIREAAKEKTA